MGFPGRFVPIRFGPFRVQKEDLNKSRKFDNSDFAADMRKNREKAQNFFKSHEWDGTYNRDKNMYEDPSDEEYNPFSKAKDRFKPTYERMGKDKKHKGHGNGFNKDNFEDAFRAGF